MTTVGDPSASMISSAVEQSQIILSFCFIQGSSSTAPAILEFDIPVQPVTSGTYSVRLSALIRAENGSQCQDSVVLVDTTTLVVSPSSKRTVVEYYNAQRDHYFQTADADEIAGLDGGVFLGWQRTGQTFAAYASEVVSPDTPTRAVCRYYGKPELDLDTHFFSAFEEECAIIPTAFPNQWILERDNAFGIAIPAMGSGQCAFGTVPVYRMLNGRHDVNHRYTTSLVIRQQMIDQGWIVEGYGTIGVAMCAELF